MKVSVKFLVASVTLASFASCSKDPSYVQSQSNKPVSQTEVNSGVEAIIFKATGDVKPALTEFQNLLGKLNSDPGAVGGRREINWDGGPAALTNNELFPGDFFAATDPLLPNGRKRGLLYTTPGTGFSISDSS